jgi:GPI mannosyltransferase 3
MRYFAVDRRLTASPGKCFARRDWIALLLICLLAVTIRASVMAFFPGVLHPDEVMWLDQANRVVNHQGIVPWDFQVGERSWLWPGLMAGFMALGQLFASPPAGALGGVSALLCAISLAPVICGYLWGRNLAGFAGAITAGLLNAVWFEIVYFYSHPLSETAAGASLVVGLYLVYPGRGLLSERQLFIGAMMLGLTAVLRPQLLPIVALIVIAIGGVRVRAHYPALLGGLTVPIVLSGMLDWITWGWPFHASVMYVYYMTLGGEAAFFRHNPFYSFIGWQWIAWGGFGVVIIFSAVYGALRLPLVGVVALAIFVLHSAISLKEYRYISPSLPLIITLSGIGSVLAADWLAERLGRPAMRSALMVTLPLAWTVASLALATSHDRIWYWVRSRGSVLSLKAVSAAKDSCGVAFYPGTLWFRTGGYVNLRPGIPFYDAGESAVPVAPNAYNYLVSLQARSQDPNRPVDLPVDLASSGYSKVRCWTDPYDRAMILERTCLWRRPGTCDPKSARLLTPDVGAAFEALISR